MYLERLHTLRAAEQSLSIQKFLKIESASGVSDPALDYYEQEYSSWFRGVAEIIKLSQSIKLSSYLLRRQFLGETVGIGSIIQGVNVRDRKSGMLQKVHDLDYILTGSAADEDHAMAAELLIKKSKDIVFKRERRLVKLGAVMHRLCDADMDHHYVVSVDPANPYSNRGFQLVNTMRSAPLIYIGFDNETVDYDALGYPPTLLYGHDAVIRAK